MDNSEDIIDSRDVIARIDELEADGSNGATLDDDEADELDALRALRDEAEGSPDWRYGETLIRDSYFEEYARQLAEDIGAVKGDESWPLSYIDWERAADALKMDYFSVDFDGVTYWVRS